MRVFIVCLAIGFIACGSPSGAADMAGATADLAQSPGGGGGSGGGGSGGTGGNGSATDMASSSASGDMASTGLCCGQPGDTGNELGVGKYCNALSDCSGNMANLCATLGDPKLHFCTFACQMGGNCGTGAACQCQGGQCGCFPNACLGMPSTC